LTYICFGYFDEQKIAALPTGRLEQIMSGCGPHMVRFHDSGKVIFDAGLANESVTLRRVDDRIVSESGTVIPGPMRVGAVFVIDAPDIDEAIRVASLHPTTQLPEAHALGWAIQIHPLHTFTSGVAPAAHV
jgi:hypothetical protein